LDAIRALAARMALENEQWDYTRIVGELTKLGHTVPRSTVRRILKERGVDPAPERLQRMPRSTVRLPPRSPNLNASAERFVFSTKPECLNRLVLLGARNLRRAIGEYVQHSHLERTQQGLGNRLIEGVPEQAPAHTCRRTG
jgi:transposase InsO family protein